MTDMVKFGFVFCIALLSAVMFAGCSEPKEEKEVVFLIKTPDMVITRFDFAEELDLKRAAYPYNIDENPAEYNEMVIHMVRTLSEEIILLSEAASKGVMITDEELRLAGEKFKKDYPEDSFDQMLLKNAISYSFWKKRFKRNLIIEKLVEQELTSKIEITSQDIVVFYNQLKEKGIQQQGSPPESDQSVASEKELVSRLRMQKTQDLYNGWIEKLTDQYPVEINKEELKTFLIALDKNIRKTK